MYISVLLFSLDISQVLRLQNWNWNWIICTRTCNSTYMYKQLHIHN